MHSFVILGFLFNVSRPQKAEIRLTTLSPSACHHALVGHVASHTGVVGSIPHAFWDGGSKAAGSGRQGPAWDSWELGGDGETLASL